MAKILSGLSKVVLDFDGNPATRPIVVMVVENGQHVKKSDVVEVTIGWLMGNLLAGTRSSDPVRAMELAVKLRDTDRIVVDDSDVDMIQQSLDNNSGVANLTYARLITVLKEAEPFELSDKSVNAGHQKKGGKGGSS